MRCGRSTLVRSAFVRALSSLVQSRASVALPRQRVERLAGSVFEQFDAGVCALPAEGRDEGRWQ